MSDPLYDKGILLNFSSLAFVLDPDYYQFPRLEIRSISLKKGLITPMKISGIIWGGELPLISKACKTQGIDHLFYTSTAARNPEIIKKAIASI